MYDTYLAEWPPAILFDPVYADAVIRNFGTQMGSPRLGVLCNPLVPQADYKVLIDERATEVTEPSAGA